MCQGRSPWQTVFCQEIPLREKKKKESNILKLFRIFLAWKFKFQMDFFVGCLVTRWNSLKKVVCIVIVKRKNGKWKCKLSFDGLGLLKYGLLFPRSFSKLSFVTEAAHPRQELPGRRKLERQFSTWKTSPFFKDQMVAKNTLRYSQIPSLRTCLYSLKSSK